MVNEDIKDKILNIILQEQDKSINPLINNKGEIIYPLLEGIDIRVLDGMVSSNILEKRIYDRVLICPQHRRCLLYSRLYCPKCNSTDVNSIYLIEHILCGYINEINRFKGHDDLVCPKCNTAMNDKSTLVLGRWYSCNSCGNRFNNPIIKLHCYYNHDVDVRDADTIILYSYTLYKGTIVGENDIRTLLDSIYNTLRSKGFNVMKNHQLKGSSNMLHNVSIYAEYKGRYNIVIEYCINKENKKVGQDEFLQAIIKINDIQPQYSILICVPDIEDNLRDIATTNNIYVVSGNNMNSIIVKVLDIITSQVSI